MSVTVAAAKVEYKNKSLKLHAQPRGVVVKCSSVSPNAKMNEADGTFFGISMAPTLSENSEANIGVAVGGVCTALVDEASQRPTPHLGTQLYVDGTTGKLTVNPTGQRPVATYLQKNGGNTALVWLSAHRVYSAVDSTPHSSTAGFAGGDGAARRRVRAALPATKPPALKEAQKSYAAADDGMVLTPDKSPKKNKRAAAAPVHGATSSSVRTSSAPTKRAKKVKSKQSAGSMKNSVDKAAGSK